MSKLTVTKIRGITEPGKYGDGRNLWLIVGPTGRKRWEFRYTRAGQRRYMGLGSIEFMTLDEARDRALQLRKMLHEGRDPLSEREVEQAEQAAEQRQRQKAAEVFTFKDAAERAIASYEKGWTNDKAARQWGSSLERYAYPFIGDTDVREITPKDVFDLLEPIWQSKHATATRVRGRIERVLDFARALELREGDNPADMKGPLGQLLPQIAKPEKHHDAMPVHDVAEFMAELRQREGIASSALEFTILTAARTSEVTEARWSEIDFDNAIWTVPAERMKTRRTNSNDHRVPLSEDAMAVLKSLPRDHKNDYVFISTMRAGEPLSNMAMTGVLKRMKRKKGVTVHGFRSTFRDWAAERTSYANEVVEMALAHVIGNRVEAAYRRGDLLEKRRALMADWAAFCQGENRDRKVVGIRG